MILRAVCVLLSMVLGAETLPFSNMNLRPARVNQADPNFHRPYTALYPLLALPVRNSPRMFFSGHPHLPNHQPALLSSNFLNRIEQKFDGFIPTRSTIPSRFSVHQYLSDIRQQTARKIKLFKQYEKRRAERMRQVEKMLHHKFKLEDRMDRIKQTLLDKEASMNAPDWIGWRGKFVGVPYNTMNEDHMIVKKPGVDLGPLSQPDIEIPTLVPGPGARPIATQHPVIPDMTTSVDLHQESEVPAATAGYMFPITRTTYVPEVIDTTEITNCIGENGSTRPQLPAKTFDKTDASISTMSSTDPTTESTILNTYMTRIPHGGGNGSTAETIFTTVNVFSQILDENSGGLTVGDEATTEFDSNLYFNPLIDTRWKQTEATSLAPSTSQPITTIDVFSRSSGSPMTSLVIDVESTMDNISPTFLSTTTITDDGFANSINYSGTRIAEVVSTTPSTLSTNTTFGMEETSSLSSALETSTVAPGVFTTMDSGVTGPTIAPESTSDVIFTFSYEISTETTSWSEPDSGITPLGYNQIRSSIDPVETTTEVDSTLPREILTQTTATSEVISAGTGSLIDSTIIDEETTTEVTVSTFSSTASTETVETSAPEISTGVGSTVASSLPTETTTTVTERLTTVDRPFDHSTIDVEKTIKIVSTLSSMILNETTAAWVEMSSTPGSPYDNLTNDEKTTAEMVLTYFSGIPTETTTMVPEKLTYDDLELNNSTIDIGTTVENDLILLSTTANMVSTPLEGTSTSPISSFDSTTVEAITTTEVISTLSSAVSTETTEPSKTTALLDEVSSWRNVDFTTLAIQAESTTAADSILSSTTPTEATTMATQKLTIVDEDFTHSTIDMNKTTNIVPTLPSMNPNETATTWMEVFTTDSPFDNSTNDEKTTAEMVLTYFSGIPTETTTMVPEKSTYDDLELNNSAIDIGTTVENDSIILSTTSNVVSTPLEGTSISPISSFDSTTVEAITTAEVISTLSSAVSTETTGSPKMTTLLDEVSSNRNVDFTTLAIQAESTTGADSILSSKTPTEATTMATQKFTIVDEDFTHSTIEMNKTTNIFPTLPSMNPNETATTWMEVLTPFDNSTNDEKTTNAVVSTLSSINPTELTTRVSERLTTIDLSDGDPTIERYATTGQIGAMFPFATSNETTPNLGEISTTTSSLFDSSKIDEKTSMEVTSMVLPTVLTEITETSEITTLVDLLQRFQDDVFTGSTTPGVDLTSSSATRKEKTTTVPERLTNIDPAFDYLTIDMKGTTEIVSMLPSAASTDTTTTLEGISTTTSSPFDSSMIDEETTMELAPIFTSTVHTDGEATTSLKEIPTEPEAYSSSTADGKTTMEIVSTLSAVTSTEETDAATQKNYFGTKRNVQDLEGNPDNTDRRAGRMLYQDSDPLPPWFARAIQEKLDEQTLPSLIPLIIGELRKNKVTPKEKHTLSQFFGDIWPLLLEESKRKQGQLMDHNLAILLSEAGQQP